MRKFKKKISNKKAGPEGPRLYLLNQMLELETAEAASTAAATG